MSPREQQMHIPQHDYRFQVALLVSLQCSSNYQHAAAKNTSYHVVMDRGNEILTGLKTKAGEVGLTSKSLSIMWITIVCWQQNISFYV